MFINGRVILTDRSLCLYWYLITRLHQTEQLINESCPQILDSQRCEEFSLSPIRSSGLLFTLTNRRVRVDLIVLSPVFIPASCNLFRCVLDDPDPPHKTVCLRTRREVWWTFTQVHRRTESCLFFWSLEFGITGVTILFVWEPRPTVFVKRVELWRISWWDWTWGHAAAATWWSWTKTHPALSSLFTLNDLNVQNEHDAVDDEDVKPKI